MKGIKRYEIVDNDLDEHINGYAVKHSAHIKQRTRLLKEVGVIVRKWYHQERKKGYIINPDRFLKLESKLKSLEGGSIMTEREQFEKEFKRINGYIMYDEKEYSEHLESKLSKANRAFQVLNSNYNQVRFELKQIRK